jgi:hypothetical protein
MAEEIPAFLRAEIGNNATDPTQEARLLGQNWPPGVRRLRGVLASTFSAIGRDGGPRAL